MLIVTTETIQGKNLEMLGMVKGSTIQTVNAFRDIGAGLKTLVGGELKKYNEMMDKARQIATERMVEEATWCGCYCVRALFHFCNHAERRGSDGIRYGGEIQVKEKRVISHPLFYIHHRAWGQ